MEPEFVTLTGSIIAVLMVAVTALAKRSNSQNKKTSKPPSPRAPDHQSLLLLSEETGRFQLLGDEPQGGNVDTTSILSLILREMAKANRTSSNGIVIADSLESIAQLNEIRARNANEMRGVLLRESADTRTAIIQMRAEIRELRKDLCERDVQAAQSIVEEMSKQFSITPKGKK